MNSRVPMDWFMASNPWTVYRTMVDLLDLPPSHPQSNAAKNVLLDSPLIISLINDTMDWQNVVVNSHKKASLPMHKLAFLADVGVTATDRGMHNVLSKVMEHSSAEGLFQVLMNIPTHFGGSGTNEWAWACCDAPLVLYSLVKMGLAEDERVRSAIQVLIEFSQENGWRCIVSKNLGKFRGPGRKDDPCPYATLLMVKLLALLPEFKDSPAIRQGAETLLALWNQSKTLHPYMFFMGNDFRKLKAPLIWYDILHVCDVLSQFPWLYQDERFLDLCHALEMKVDPEGRFTPESVWQAWKGWDFAQKSEPSPWLTFLIWRIIRRVKPESIS